VHADTCVKRHRPLATRCVRWVLPLHYVSEQGHSSGRTKALDTRDTTHDTRHTTHDTRHTAHDKRHTTHSTRHTAHETRHTTHDTQHTTNDTRHATHDTRHTATTPSAHLRLDIIVEEVIVGVDREIDWGRHVVVPTGR
jgi:hypothetical protein